MLNFLATYAASKMGIGKKKKQPEETTEQPTKQTTEGWQSIGNTLASGNIDQARLEAKKLVRKKAFQFLGLG